MSTTAAQKITTFLMFEGTAEEAMTLSWQLNLP
jgi:predicted 3-demethylubiquinone-9 3-methyltransferase (glyoxalase superfamily)